MKNSKTLLTGAVITLVCGTIALFYIGLWWPLNHPVQHAVAKAVGNHVAGEIAKTNAPAPERPTETGLIVRERASFRMAPISNTSPVVVPEKSVRASQGK